MDAFLEYYIRDLKAAAGRIDATEKASQIEHQLKVIEWASKNINKEMERT